ncbi:MAG: lycopene beta-cyclase CrtY [Croceibacterium sp.]
MTGRDCDIAIVGGGLAGGLIALALGRARPELAVRLIESGPRLGGNHRWSWFASDLSPAGADLLAPFHKAEWDHGYAVAFPGLRRHLATGYRSLASPDFAAGLMRELSAGTVLTGCAVRSLDRRGIDLADGERIAARVVIDARGPVDAAQLTGGWQVFLGRHVRTAAPHGVARPMIMDASVAQLGGYRFVYVLPLGAHELFVEDTYYQDAPLLDRAALSARLDAYCAHHGWGGEVVAEETGVLPVITGGDFAAFQAAHHIPGVAVVGARGGFVHPLTSYTLPFAVETAFAIAAQAGLLGDTLAELIAARARRHWHATRFYRRLGAMLFTAASPDQRWRVFERFYRLPEPLIERFYAGRSTMTDKARVLCGRPPVPLTGALRALTTQQPSLKAAA